MSASLNLGSEWNFRIIDQRLIIIKTKNENVRKAAVLDVVTNLPFALNVPEDMPLDSLETEKEYLAHLKVYTSKDLEGVDKDFIGFFDALDIDQTTENFLKAYWVYPNKIRFDLDSIEEP